MLLPVVDDRNTIVEYSERNCILGQTDISRHGRKSGLIVVFQKVAQQGGVLAGRVEPLNIVGELCHGRRSGRKGANHPVVRSIVEHTRHVILPGAQTVWITIKNFADGIDASGGNEARPE